MLKYKFSIKLKNYKTILSNLKFYFLHSFYSETGEDIIASQLFDKKVGKFLDVGSGQPVIGNNTFLLYRQGWSGICVDPQLHLSKAYKFIGPRDIYINKPVSGSKQVNFYDFCNPLLSTIDDKVAKFHINNGMKYSKRVLSSISIHDLLDPEISSSSNFLLSIDIEGSELEIIKEINFVKQRPRVILIESWEAPWKKNSLSEFMERVNYKLFAYTGLTAVYLPREVKFKVENLRTKLAMLIEKKR